MSKTLINFWLDVLLLVLFSTLFWLSAVIRFVFPPGPNADGWQLWHLNYRQWSEAQFALLCALTFAVLLHVMLHWNWVCGVIASKFLRTKEGKKVVIDEGARTIYGVGLLIVLLGLMGVGFGAAVVMIDGP